jgi:hypothetical protein
LQGGSFNIQHSIIQQADEESDVLSNENEIIFLVMRMKEAVRSKSDHFNRPSKANNSSINKKLTVQKLNDGGKINYACYSKKN